MSTKTIIAWIDGDAQYIEVEDYKYVEHIKTIEDRIFALEQYQCPEFVSSVTLLAENWVGDENLYTQIVDIDGVTECSKVDLQPSSEQLKIFRDKDLSFVTENDNGVITVYCIGQKPINDYIMQVTITEVIVNE